METILIIFVLILIAAIFCYHYIFSIYEVNFELSLMSSKNDSEITMSAVPINAFGWKVLLKNSYADFQLIEGEHLVEIVDLNKKKGKIKLRSKNKAGTVIISVKPKYSLFPSVFEIPIYSNAF